MSNMLLDPIQMLTSLELKYSTHLMSLIENLMPAICGPGEVSAPCHAYIIMYQLECQRSEAASPTELSFNLCFIYVCIYYLVFNAL